MGGPPSGPVIFDSNFWSRHFIEKSGVFLNARRFCSAKITFLSYEMSCTGSGYFFKAKIHGLGKIPKVGQTPPRPPFGTVPYEAVTKGGGVTATGYLCVQEERGGLPLYPCGWGLCGYNIYGLPLCGNVHTVPQLHFSKKIVFLGEKPGKTAQNRLKWAKIGQNN